MNKSFWIGLVAAVIGGALGAWFLFGRPAWATISNATASEWSQFCSQNSSICNKVTETGTLTGSRNYELLCPRDNQAPDKLLVHAGDGQIVYQLPHNGFGYSLGGYNAEVWRTTHSHGISWVMLICESTVTPTPSPSPTLVPTPSATPSTTPVASPSPSSTPEPSSIPDPSATPEPSPSEEPRVSPTPTPEPCRENCSPPDSEHHDDVVYVGPQCTGTGTKKPTLQFVGSSDGCATFVYYQTDAYDHAVFVYGYSPDNLEYGIPFLPNNASEIVVCGLELGRHVWGQVGTEVNFCMERSDIVDPVVQ